GSDDLARGHNALRAQVLAEAGAPSDVIVDERRILDKGATALLDPELAFDRKRRHRTPHRMPPRAEQPAKLGLRRKARARRQFTGGDILCDPISGHLPLLEPHSVLEFIRMTRS